MLLIIEIITLLIILCFYYVTHKKLALIHENIQALCAYIVKQDSDRHAQEQKDDLDDLNKMVEEDRNQLDEMTLEATKDMDEAEKARYLARCEESYQYGRNLVQEIGKGLDK